VNLSWKEATAACKGLGGALAGFPLGRYRYDLPNFGKCMYVTELHLREMRPCPNTQFEVVTTAGIYVLKFSRWLNVEE
jgi:hypothetical protein